MGQWMHEWLALAHLIQRYKMSMASQGPIVHGTVEMRMPCMGPLESVPMVSSRSLFNWTVCTRMVRSGSGSEALSYDDIIV